MGQTPIAKVRLAAGQVGYYDDYSKIYLSTSNPEAVIYAGTNMYQIKKSIKSGRLKLVSGSLSNEKPVKENKVKKVETKVTKQKVEKAAPVEEIKEAPVEIAQEEVEEEATVAEIANVQEEIIEQPNEDVVVEEKSSRKRRRRKETAVEETMVEEEQPKAVQEETIQAEE